MIVTTNSPEETLDLGKKVGKLLKPGDVLCLEGDLGAGKTHFAKGIALGLGVRDHVTSPTFNIINEYEGKVPFYHIDAYRLEDSDEGAALGLEEYFYGPGVTVVEWPGQIENELPPDYLQVNIIKTSEEGREFHFKPKGSGFLNLLEELK